MPFYDFTCEAGHEFEARAGVDTDTLPCRVCDRVAKRSSIYLNVPLTATGLTIGKETVPFHKQWAKPNQPVAE